MATESPLLLHLSQGLSPLDLKRRFADVVTIRDPAGFKARMRDFVSDLEREAAQRVAAQAKIALVAWAPSATEIQRGRAIQVKEFSKPSNLPLVKFAELAHKSRQQIYKDVAARRLLALNLGRRGINLPDWQLQPKPLQLTQALLEAAGDIDNWTLYDALGQPLEPLGKSPVDASRTGNIPDILNFVLGSLGVHADSDQRVPASIDRPRLPKRTRARR